MTESTWKGKSVEESDGLYENGGKEGGTALEAGKAEKGEEGDFEMQHGVDKRIFLLKL